MDLIRAGKVARQQSPRFADDGGQIENLAVQLFATAECENAADQIGGSAAGLIDFNKAGVCGVIGRRVG